MVPKPTRSGARALFLALAAALISIAPFFAADVALVGVAVSDNGDRDGFADTNETVELRLTLRNDLPEALTGLQARLASNDPKIARIFNPTLPVGDLEAGETRTLPVSFRFQVADVQRTSVYEDFSAALAVTLIAAGSRIVSLAPNPIVLQLDLDATEAGAPIVFFEGFEDGTLGAMAPMNLDAGLYSLKKSDGYRCQYSDPDWVGSNSYGMISDCWLGATEEQADAFFWQVVDGQDGSYEGRSFTGRYSVWRGTVNPDFPEEHAVTSPMASLEAVVTAEPLNLALGTVCEVTRTIACKNDHDCPDGEACVEVMPELTFKHQISLPDWRVVGTSSPYRTSDGGVVMLQIVNRAGQPRSDWMRLEPYANVYDEQKEDNYTNCQFDPIDDGNTEDDFYDPEDPERRLGPSSLCYPQWIYTWMGDTDEPFDPANLGHAAGPALEGETGLGVWVESRFDLSQYKGQRVLIRFIAASIKAGNAETYDDLFRWNPIAGDDGWWIDDITVKDAAAAPAMLSVDEKDNSALSAGERLRTLEARPAP